MELKSRKRSHAHAPYRLCLILVLVASFILSTAFYYGVSPTGGSDNYIYSYNAYAVLSQGPAALMNGGEDKAKLLLVFAIALFYKILGASRFSGALFGICTLLATSVVLYLIGGKLYDKRAGLLAAFLYGIFPLAVTQASSVGDDAPMAFFVALAFYLLILGRDKRPRLLALSGFVGCLGFLVTPEELIVAVPILVILFADLAIKRDKARFLNILNFVFGFLIGIAAMMAIGYLLFNDVLYAYNQVAPNFTNWCSNGGACISAFPIFQENINMLYPYGIISKISAAFNSLSLQSIPSFLASIVKTNYGPTDSTYNFGFYYYFLLVSALILLFAREKRAAVPATWLVATFLYLSFGTMSISHWAPIVIIYPRLTLVFAPPMALLLSFGLVRLTEIKQKGRRKTARLAYLIVALIVGFLAVQSVYLIMSIQYSWYNVLYKSIELGSYINALPRSTSVMLYSNWAFIIEYTDHTHNIIQFDPRHTQCDGMPSGSYVIMPANQTIENECGLSVALTPAVPSWLSGYNIYNPSGWDPPNQVLYYKP